MGSFIEVLDHPKLSPEEREFIGMKGRVITHYRASARSLVYLTDKREIVLPVIALRPIAKKD